MSPNLEHHTMEGPLTQPLWPILKTPPIGTALDLLLFFS